MTKCRTLCLFPVLWFTMPILLRTQQHLRASQKLPFCYLCTVGIPDLYAKDINREHVMPSGLFLPPDRDVPLILPSHVKCNGDESDRDNVVAYLVNMLHGKKPDFNKLKMQWISDPDGGPPRAVMSLDLKGAIWRWVRGFHAALYGQPLPLQLRSKALHPPFAEADPKTGGVSDQERLDQHSHLVAMLRNARAEGNLDRVEIRNDKCTYECTWIAADEGVWACFFAIKLYDWTVLGETDIAPARDCVGMYAPVGGLPSGASTSTSCARPDQPSGHLKYFENPKPQGG